MGKLLENSAKNTANQGEMFTTFVRKISDELSDRINAVCSSLHDVSRNLQETKSNELQSLSRDVRSLEQKFDHWVDIFPLPAKISEARLFALEVRQEEEFNARLEIEERMKSKRSPPRLPRLLVAGGNTAQRSMQRASN